MSDTPRTDAALKVLSNMKIPYGAWNDASFVSDFARQLERELAAANEACRKASLDALHMRDGFLKELAAKDTEKYCFVSCAFHAAQDAEIARLREAANAVVERWETPLWKDVKPTAHIIYALRDELAAQQQASK